MRSCLSFVFAMIALVAFALPSFAQCNQCAGGGVVQTIQVPQYQVAPVATVNVPTVATIQVPLAVYTSPAPVILPQPIVIQKQKIFEQELPPPVVVQKQVRQRVVQQNVVGGGSRQFGLFNFNRGNGGGNRQAGILNISR
jgi:hypothetical protein